LSGNRQSSDNGFNFDAKHHTVANNSITVETFRKKPLNSEGFIIDEKGEICGWGTTGEMFAPEIRAKSQKSIGQPEPKNLQLAQECVSRFSPTDWLVSLDCHV
jgi:hypothetical protein